MIKYISKENCIFRFSKTNSPAIRVMSGETVEIETMDCFADQLKTPQDTLEALDWDKVNPATGPVYIEGALPGDVLKVTINDISVQEQGVIATGKDLGVLGASIEGLVSRLIPIRDGRAIFNERLSIPLNPMIGVIGVAPSGEDINCGTPGSHGGNMDNKMVTTGATIYFPVFVEGALFALGDLHAAMGDGEIGVSGIEVPGRVTVTLEIVRGTSLSNPLLENKDFVTTIASAPALDEAVQTAVSDMAKLLAERTDLPLEEIAMLLSVVGNVQICQVVDPLKTVRFAVPKGVLDSLGVKFL